MPERPTGTVTFLFTDIEGSTRLLQELRELYADVLIAHARIIRAAIEEFGGHEIDTQGDSFFAPIATTAISDFFSARIGCQVFHPVWGISLSALCLRRPGR